MYPFEVFADPQRLHAAVVHLPVAMALLGIPLVYLTAISSSDKETLRWLTLAWYALMIPLALLAQWTGEHASDQVPNTLSKAVIDQVDQHEWMAEKVWVFAAVTAVLVAVSTLKIRWFRMAVMSLAMVASLATGGWVAVTGHLGGDLVYSHGVGTPGNALNRPLPPAPAVQPTPPPAAETRPPAAVTPPTESAPPMTPPEAAPVPAPESSPGPTPPSIEAPAPPAPSADPATAAPADLSPAIRPIVPEEAAKVSYVRDVRPILDEHCMECHDAEDRRGDLCLETVPDMLKPGKKAGPGVIPFKPDESAVVQYIRGMKQPQMPKRKNPLSEDELHIIRMWIAAGAVDDSQPAPVPSPTNAEPAPPAPAPDLNAPAPSPSRENALEAGHAARGLLLVSREP